MFRKMSRTFALVDHKCSELEKLLEEKKVSYEWFVCGCSPIERQYQIIEEGEWADIDNCPFCGASMTGIVEWAVAVGPSALSLYSAKPKGAT